MRLNASEVLKSIHSTWLNCAAAGAAIFIDTALHEKAAVTEAARAPNNVAVAKV